MSGATDNFSEVRNGLLSETHCTMEANIVRNFDEIAQVIMDEPSRLVAEFGPRDEPKSWLSVILRSSKSCSNSIPAAVEL